MSKWIDGVKKQKYFEESPMFVGLYIMDIAAYQIKIFSKPDDSC